MSLKNTRIQYAVGQGGFHAGKLEDSSEHMLRYVVDCGSMSTYAKSRDQCIDDYLAAEGPRATLDLLFITHAHADHVNGIERLLNSSSGMRVKAIVMPLLSVEERVLCFARTAAEDRRGSLKPFYRDFIVDPVAAVARFDPEQIFLVTPSDTDNGAPFSRDEDEQTQDQLNPETLPDSNDGRSWRPVGVGTPSPHSPATGLGKSKRERAASLASVVPDSMGFLYHSADTNLNWLLAPYVDHGVQAGSGKFFKELASQLNLSAPKLKAWLANISNVKSLVTKDVAKLVAAYKTLGKDLNVTSLTVYSGPTCEYMTDLSISRVGFNLWNHWNHWNHWGKIGWLGTGDAALKATVRRNAFFAHYGQLLDLVFTFTLPHHGSEGNFDDSLLSKIKPIHCVAAADHVPNWRHPGTKVVQSVGSAGAILSVITSAKASEIKERVTVWK